MNHLQAKNQKKLQLNLVLEIQQQLHQVTQMHMHRMVAQQVRMLQIIIMVEVDQQQVIKVTEIMLQIHGINIHNPPTIVDINGMATNITIFKNHQIKNQHKIYVQRMGFKHLFY